HEDWSECDYVGTFSIARALASASRGRSTGAAAVHTRRTSPDRERWQASVERIADDAGDGRTGVERSPRHSLELPTAQELHLEEIRQTRAGTSRSPHSP